MDNYYTTTLVQVIFIYSYKDAYEMYVCKAVHKLYVYEAVFKIYSC